MNDKLFLIKNNLGLVHTIAWRYAKYDYSLYEELVDEGYLILSRCANSFEEMRGEFKSYLGNALEYGLRLYMRNNKGFDELTQLLEGNVDLVDDSVQKEIKEVLRNALAKLNDKERFIIKNYYGLGTSKKTLEEIAMLLGYNNHQRISQIKERALRKLRYQLQEWR